MIDARSDRISAPHGAGLLAQCDLTSSREYTRLVSLAIANIRASVTLVLSYAVRRGMSNGAATRPCHQTASVSYRPGRTAAGLPSVYPGQRVDPVAVGLVVSSTSGSELLSVLPGRCPVPRAQTSARQCSTRGCGDDAACCDLCRRGSRTVRVSPALRGRQSDVAFLTGSGHQVVLGTAGTGKTTMAMHRAAHLADPYTQNSGSVLLVTYNRTLVTYLEYLRGRSTFDITIETYGKFARGYLSSMGLMPGWGGIATPGQRHKYVENAVINVASGYQPHAFFRRETGFFLDELEWISGMGIQTLEEYEAVERVGRKTGLSGSVRGPMWQILTEYRRIRDEAGREYDWYDLATAVRAALATDRRPRRYKHIVIDEGQDLSPEAVRSLVEACDPRGSVTFFGDYHQVIYGQGVSWRSCGLVIQKAERFADNYRNTTEIARLAIAMSEMPAMAGDPLEPGRSPGTGRGRFPADPRRLRRRGAGDQDRAGAGQGLRAERDRGRASPDLGRRPPGVPGTALPHAAHRTYVLGRTRRASTAAHTTAPKAWSSTRSSCRSAARPTCRTRTSSPRSVPRALPPGRRGSCTWASPGRGPTSS